MRFHADNHAAIAASMTWSGRSPRPSPAEPLALGSDPVAIQRQRRRVRVDHRRVEAGAGPRGAGLGEAPAPNHRITQFARIRALPRREVETPRLQAETLSGRADIGPKRRACMVA